MCVCLCVRVRVCVCVRARARVLAIAQRQLSKSDRLTTAASHLVMRPHLQMLQIYLDCSVN